MLQSIQRELGTHAIEYIERVRNTCYRAYRESQEHMLQIISIVRSTCYRAYRESQEPCYTAYRDSQEHMLQSIQRELGTHAVEHIERVGNTCYRAYRERVRNNCYRCSQHIINVTAGHHRQRMCGALVQMVIVHRVSKAPVQLVIACRQWKSTCRQMSNSAHRRMCHYISLLVEQSGVY